MEKLILLGKRKSDGKRVVIKATSDKNGMYELEHERICRDVLQKINFAYKTFLSPEEILFAKTGGYIISIQEFIEQEKLFLSVPLRNNSALHLRLLRRKKGHTPPHTATRGL